MLWNDYILVWQLSSARVSPVYNLFQVKHKSVLL